MHIRKEGIENIMLKIRKILSIFLASLLVFSFAAFTAGAEDAPAVCTVVPVDDTFVIVPVNGAPSYVNYGEPFSFTIVPTSDKSFNTTTRVKYYDADRYPDMLAGAQASDYNDYIYPDANGVFTIPSVTEDLVVEVFNYYSTGNSSIVDFVYGLFNFFITWMRWFFGLGKA